jgi:hypothetical protein
MCNTEGRAVQHYTVTQHNQTVRMIHTCTHASNKPHINGTSQARQKGALEDAQPHDLCIKPASRVDHSWHLAGSRPRPHEDPPALHSPPDCGNQLAWTTLHNLPEHQVRRRTRRLSNTCHLCTAHTYMHQSWIHQHPTDTQWQYLKSTTTRGGAPICGISCQPTDAECVTLRPLCNATYGSSSTRQYTL